MNKITKPWKVDWRIRPGDKVTVYTEVAGALYTGVVSSTSDGKLFVHGMNFDPRTCRTYLSAKHSKRAFYIRPYQIEDDAEMSTNSARDHVRMLLGQLWNVVEAMSYKQCDEIAGSLQKTIDEVSDGSKN